METRRGLGPVFAFEWLTYTRRWQVYALRAGFVAMLLASLTVVWYSEVAGRSLPTIRQKAEVGRMFAMAIIGTQLVLVLLAAPATTAGAICLDKARGSLAHLLVTDLTAAEIILGKLVSRLIPVFGLVACALPAMALGTLLGGVDPRELTGAFLLSLGLGALGSSLALVFSVWGRKAHEVLLTAYAVLLVWVLGGPACSLLRWTTGWGWWLPDWLTRSSPFWLAFASTWEPEAVSLTADVQFLAATWTLSALLAVAAMAGLRRAATRQPVGGPRRLLPALRWPEGLRLDGWLGPQLDPNPVLWREWHRRRPTRWGRVLWVAYGAAAVGVTLVMLYCSVYGNVMQREVSMVLNGGQVALGFLFLSVTAAASLSEERVRGSLDVLLATPMSTPAIVWGKWWGTFRGTAVLCVLPGLVACAVALRTDRWLGVVLEVAYILAFGAALTSLGLAIATWVPRLGRAIGLTVTAYILVTVGWLFLAVMLTRHTPGVTGPGLASASPFIGSIFPLIEMQQRRAHEWPESVAWLTLWTAAYAALAIALFATTVATFDQCLERVKERLFEPPAPTPWAKPKPKPLAVHELA